MKSDDVMSSVGKLGAAAALWALCALRADWEVREACDVCEDADDARTDDCPAEKVSRIDDGCLAGCVLALEERELPPEDWFKLLNETGITISPASPCSCKHEILDVINISARNLCKTGVFNYKSKQNPKYIKML